MGSYVKYRGNKNLEQESSISTPISWFQFSAYTACCAILWAFVNVYRYARVYTYIKVNLPDSCAHLIETKWFIFIPMCFSTCKFTVTTWWPELHLINSTKMLLINQSTWLRKINLASFHKRREPFFKKKLNVLLHLPIWNIAYMEWKSD